MYPRGITLFRRDTREQVGGSSSIDPVLARGHDSSEFCRYTLRFVSARRSRLANGAPPPTPLSHHHFAKLCCRKPTIGSQQLHHKRHKDICRPSHRRTMTMLLQTTHSATGEDPANENGKKKQYPGVKNGWFTESETLWPGQKLSLALEEFSNKSILYHCETAFQSILVFKSAQYGKILVLDGVIQMTERDEFAFHEMLVHMPLCSHPNPKNVLIIGGGDGAAVFQVCLHKMVEKVTVVEIDPKVVEVVKIHFPTLAKAFDDPRVKLIHQDGAEYLKSTTETFDVILGDTLDPVGPAESLFQPEFYERMEEVLNESGMICVQAECFWTQLDLISDLYACCHDIFDYVSYASTQVPTFPCGQIGFLVAGKGRRRTHVSNPIRDCDFATKWYSSEMHRAAFVLPPFVYQQLEEKEKEPECFLTHLPSCTIL